MRLGIYGGSSHLTLKKIIVILFIIFAVIIYIVFSRLPIVFSEYASAYLQNNAIKILNNAVSDVFSEESSNSLIEIKTKSDGTVSSAELSSVKVNALTSKISDKVYSYTKELGEEYIYIPAGSLLNTELTAHWGFKIPIKVKALTLNRLEVKDEMISSGINQTNHKIYIDADVSVMLVSAVGKNQCTETFRIPLTDTIIVGDVPKYYGTDKNNGFVINSSEVNNEQ